MNLYVGNVGAVKSDPMTPLYIRKVTKWLEVNDPDFVEGKTLHHDYIDLNQGRDFLKESYVYDLVILHYIFHPIDVSDIHLTDLRDPYRRVSPLHTISQWKSRLIKTGAVYIFTFGDTFEVSGATLKEIPTYHKKARIHWVNPITVYKKISQEE